MKKWLWCVIFFVGTSVWAMPSQMTFQGTLKDKNGVPVNASENMQFSFVDGTGASIPGTSPIVISNVQVTNGLFAVQLPIDPTIPWEQYTPYVRVSVAGETLSPDQPLNANLYAAAAIPQGMIAMFANTCPAGWTRFTALDNAFPMGGATYGATGGSATHTHTLTKSADVPGAGGALAVGVFEGQHTLTAFTGGGSTTIDELNDTTDAQSNIPPYLTMVYCQKS